MSHAAANSRADQENVVAASCYNMEDIVKREEEVIKRLDAISLERDQLHMEHDDLWTKLDAVHLELQRIDQERRSLEDELDEVSLAFNPRDPDEDVDQSTGDKESAIRRRMEAVILEHSQLNKEIGGIGRKSDVISLEIGRLDQEEDDLEQECRELTLKWQEMMALNLTDQDEDFNTSTDEDIDISTDEDDFTEDLDDDLFLALSQMVSSLCFICRNLARGRSAELVTPYHLSLSSLKKSVDAGCGLCADVAESLDEFCSKSKPPVTEKNFWSFVCEVFGKDSRLVLGFYLCQCDTDHPADAHCERRQHLRSMAFYPARKLCLGPEFLDPTLRTSSAKSAESLSVARSWYRQCLHHATCRKWRQETRALPTRLIQICRPDSKPSELSARIHETKGLPTSTPYSTLSHCWGKGVIFKLLKNNLKDLSTSIPIEQLPKVFQDAIHVSYEIGINYLWIDSLCIIQDSKEDWAHEAKKMGDVYLHGEFNISATGYENGLPGLFSERKALPRVNLPLCVDFVEIDKDLKKKTAYRGIYIRVSQNEFHQQIVSSPLFERAWVAQERVLSAAIIHYTRGQIWWECNEGVLSEALTENPFVDGQLIWDSTEGSGRDRIRSLSTRSTREEIYVFWATFLDSYSHCAMTFNRDRFPALIGIARILAELIDDDFIAGFWSGDLVRSLTMKRIPMRASIQDEQLAPSWSWASSTAALGRDPDEGVSLSQVEILEGVRITRVLSDIPGFKSDLDSTSFEKSGVRGLIIRGALRRLPDESDVQPSWMEYAWMSYDNKEPCKYRGEDNIPEDQKWRLDEPTHMLLLAKARSPKWVRAGSGISVLGILLQVADMEGSCTFRRSGQIHLSFSEGEQWEEYFGLRKKEEEYESNFDSTSRGLQEVVLI